MVPAFQRQRCRHLSSSDVRNVDFVGNQSGAKMLRDDDLELLTGRGVHGGNCLILVHKPTGIQRSHPGPLTNVNEKDLLASWRAEIEPELRSIGSYEHIEPSVPYRFRSR